MLFLIALLASLAVCDQTAPLTSPILESRDENWCLVQSGHSIFTARLKQPAESSPAGGLETDAVAEWLTASENSTRTNATIIHHIYDMPMNWWMQSAFWLCVHWQAIVLSFTLVFALSFPFMHWTFEHRDVERAMFNSDEHEAGGSKGVAEMLKHIRINRTGGLSKQDMTLLRGAVDYYHGDRHDLLPETLQRYLEFTGKGSLISVRHAAFVALAELLGLAAMVVWIIYRFVVFRFCKNTHDAKFDAFLALHEIFHGANLLGGFSALRLVSVVHPALIMRQFQWNMARPFLAANTPFLVGTRETLQLAYFAFTRFFAVFLGVLAFGVKLAFTSVQVHMPLVAAAGAQATGWNWWATFLWRWCVVLMLLEQTLGAVAVEHVMWWRVILVVAEGGDRQITLDKIQVMYVYLSRIMQSIYEEYWCKGMYRHFFVLMLTFDHVDLQYLLIDEIPTTSKTTSSPSVGAQPAQEPSGGD